MARCFLTGVQFPLEDAFVLNRREARFLLAALHDRIASLRRVIEQLAPMDELEEIDMPSHPHTPRPARKRHRLVCKAVAEAIAPAFAEVTLFQGWQEYQSQARFSTVNNMRTHSRFGKLLKDLTDDELLGVSRLGRTVLKVLDKDSKLPVSTRQAIALSACAHLRQLNANEVCERINVSAAAIDDDPALGLSSQDFSALRGSTVKRATERKGKAAKKPSEVKS